MQNEQAEKRLKGKQNMLYNILQIYRQFILRALMVMMAFVLGLGAIDLAWLIIKDIIQPPYLLHVNELFDIFGLFMVVVIGIELLETLMKSYTTEAQPHHDVILSVAIIAFARKIIILDFKEVDSLGLIGIASVVIGLTVGYFLMKRSRFCDKMDKVQRLDGKDG